MEHWKDVVGFEGYYVVSDMGRIMRVAIGENGRRPGNIRHPYANGGGYPSLILSKDGKGYTRMVHRLVAEAFLGPVPDGKEVNHKDGNKNNNHVDNLEYISHSRNMKHSFDVLGHKNARGSHSGASKLTEESIPEIISMIDGGISQRKVASYFGVSQPMISYITRGLYWKHVETR